MLSSLTGTLLQTARGLVSKDKFRFIGNGFNLDLTYITERVIAMGYPGEGIHSTYRNSVDDVANFFGQFHPGKYKIFNVSEVPYSPSTLHTLGGPDRSIFLGWPDHHSPSLQRLVEVVLLMDQWLIQDPNHVAVVHCQAGRGRTGLVIAAYLLYIGLFYHAEDALNYFASARSSTGEGVTSPAQKRYCHYFTAILPTLRQCVCSPGQPIRSVPVRGNGKMNNQLRYIDFPPEGHYPVKLLQSVVLKPIPGFSQFLPSIEILNTKYWPYTHVHSVAPTRVYTNGDKQVDFLINRYIEGDVLIRIYHQSTTLGISTSNLICRYAFNTLFINSCRLENNSFVMDAKYADFDAEKSGPLKDPHFPSTFKMEIHYSDAGPSDLEQTIQKEEQSHPQNNSLYPSLDQYSSPYSSPPHSQSASPYVDRSTKYNPNMNQNHQQAMSTYDENQYPGNYGNASPNYPPQQENQSYLYPSIPPQVQHSNYSSYPGSPTQSYSYQSDYHPQYSSPQQPYQNTSPPFQPPPVDRSSKQTAPPAKRLIVVDLSSVKVFDEGAFYRFFQVCGNILDSVVESRFAVLLFEKEESAKTATYLNHGLVNGDPVVVMTLSEAIHKHPEQGALFSGLSSRLLLQSIE
eukprot:TRINITY_DN3863_c0_g1_i3.p1 TRINITY_DN3863_c0_g1~~TRINITY_DN3863_c0_g1_i3.p1  ORF type:complete len:661 (-),score=191.90 TRINITY_DN3863_c0_g1_i3:47-1927(-)